jgi:hypothetical protein
MCFAEWINVVLPHSWSFSRPLTKLQRADTQTNHILSDLSHLENKKVNGQRYHWRERTSKICFNTQLQSNTTSYQSGTLLNRGAFCTWQHSRAVLLTDLCDPADLALVGGAIAGPREGALLHWASTVQGRVRGSAQVKWIVGVVVQLVGIGQRLLACCQDLACL